MRDLIVDMTPICINKTAIYHIAVDTYHALQVDYRLTAQFRGRRSPLLTDEPVRNVAAQAFFQDVADFAAYSTHADELDLAPLLPRSDEPILFFDPIYALYQPLRPDDVVLVLDLSPLTNPEWHSPAVVRCYERAYRKLAASPARIATISAHCTAILRANFAISEGEIVTVPLYLRRLPELAATAPVADLAPGRYFLFVGSLEGRKNVVGLIRAFQMSGLADEGWKLAIAGGAGLGANEITAAARQAHGVVQTGFVTDEELAWLYRNAAAFAYPSYLEGFGLPVLEAMAYGLPCMASITGASKEVCGDLGVLVDPYRMSSIVDGLRDCQGRAAKRDAAAASRLKARAAEFTFANYLQALKRVLPV